MPMFKLQFDMSNDAFAGHTHDLEIARILVEVRNQVIAGYREGSIRDVNGNRVGQWAIEDHGEEL